MQTRTTLWALAAALVGLVLEIPNLSEGLAGPSMQAFQSSPAFRLCESGALCVHSWNLAAFALTAAAFVFLALRLRRTSSILTIVTASFLFTSSPFAVAGILDPAGAAMSAMVVLVVLAASDVLGESALLPTYGRLLLAIALVLVSPPAAVFALAYACFWNTGAARFFVGLVLVTGALSMKMAFSHIALNHLMHPAIDPLAGPTTIVALGIVLFVVTPATLYALGRFAVRLPPFRAAASLVMSFAIGIAGLFAGTGDPSPYFLAAEAALLLGIVSLVSTSGRGAVRIISLGLCLANVAIFILVHPHLVTVRIAQQSDFLTHVLEHSPLNTCVVADADARHYIFANSALAAFAQTRSVGPTLKPSVSSCMIESRNTALITVAGIHVRDWGPTGIALTRAAQVASASSPFYKEDSGIVSPRTYAPTPTKAGAFWNALDTPYGPIADLTILSGFSYVLPCSDSAAAKTLTLSAANDIPRAAPVRVGISVSAKNSASSSTTLDLPAASAYAPDWSYVALTLPRGRCSELRFSVSGEQPNTWVTLAGMSLQ